jgi:hypothetical protein
MKGRSVLVAAAVAAVAVAPVAVGHGGKKAEGTPTLTPLAEHLAGPLQLAVGHHGTVYVGQSFAGLLTKIKGGVQTTIASVPGGEIAGVSLGPKHGHQVIYYTVTTTAPDKSPVANLSKVRKGVSTVVADLQAYEAAKNPDQINSYGFQNVPPGCTIPPDPNGPPTTYTGIVESHPYASAATRKGVYVADAAGNTVLKVSRTGKVRTVAVLPPQPLVVTAEIAKGQNLPDCAVGLTYNFEPVPTDVEVGKDGWLYVTTLPGGPEDPSFPPRGGVWKINPWTGDATQIAGGLAGATNLALGRHGTIYVSEIFAGRVSRVDRKGTATPVLSLPSPAALEYSGGKLFVGYDVFEPNGNGKVGTISW